MVKPSPILEWVEFLGMYGSLDRGQITEGQAEEFESDSRDTGEPLEILRHYY